MTVVCARTDIAQCVRDSGIPVPADSKLVDEQYDGKRYSQTWFSPSEGLGIRATCNNINNPWSPVLIALS